MTREEAISIMKVIVHMLEEKYDTDRVEEAVDMAISALSEKDWKFYYDHGYAQAKRDLSENKGDLISREAVLKIIDGWYEQNRDTDNIEDLIVLITYMDSVNPQEPICPSAGIDCEDCINRQAAIDAIKNYASMLWEKYHEPFPESTIMEMIQELPPVTPQLKTRWIPVSERLPEEYCLFCDIDGDVFYGHIYDDRWWAEGQDDRIKNVIAWMPLPEPYKAEGSDKE